MSDSFKNTFSLGIRGRLLIGFGSISAILLLLVFITLSIVTVTKKSTANVIDVDLPTYDNFLNLEIQLSQTHGALLNWLSTKDPKYKSELNNAWIYRMTPLIKQIDKLAPKWNNKFVINGWETLKPQLNKLMSEQIKVINESDSQSLLEAETTNDSILTILDGPLDGLGNRDGGVITKLLATLNKGTNSILDNMSNIQILEWSLATFSIILAIIISLLTARGILRHINLFRQHSSQIAAGDLRQFITLESNDEMDQLGNDLNVMTKSLAAITNKITEACHNMVTSLDEVKHSVEMQSAGATEQASSINQITASLSKIEKSSAQTMEKAQSLGDVAERTRKKGQLGLEAVEQSIKGMDLVKSKVQLIAQTILELSNQTQQIGEITSLVNTLAQQSKMLALNASIEAAKAGEAGKGFAVVASEVKNLAEQSERATSQVQKILEDIRHAAEKAVMVTEEGTKGVEKGTELVEQTGDIMRGLTDVIHEATIASQQIGAAIRQESVGIEQITKGMNEINQVTATFVESVNQTTEVINDLSTIAKNLKDHVKIYKT